jgi:hypothetical protein
MYAAAGGASCRNARKRQQIQNVKDKEAQAKALKEKLEAAKLAQLSAHPKSKQFHQLPANYLRAPHSHGRKLSAGYTGHSSKLLLPISEQSAQHHSPSHQTLHHHQRHHFHHQNDTPRTPTHHREMRLDVEHKKLTKSATASFPLVSQAGTPPASPGVCFRQNQQFFKESQGNLLSAHQPMHIQIPGGDGIIITPATPLPSPSPTSHRKQDRAEDAKVDDMPEFPLERTCSVYRNRKLDDTTTRNDVDDEYQQQFYPGGMPNGNGGHHTHWADEFCDGENRALGICTCDHIEVI